MRRLQQQFTRSPAKATTHSLHCYSDDSRIGVRGESAIDDVPLHSPLTTGGLPLPFASSRAVASLLSCPLSALVPLCALAELSLLPASVCPSHVAAW